MQTDVKCKKQVVKYMIERSTKAVNVQKDFIKDCVKKSVINYK